MSETKSNLTVQQICTSATKEAHSKATLKAPPPNIKTAIDELTLLLLKKVEECGKATGADLAGEALQSKVFEVTAEGAYFAACALASPLVTRYPLLYSENVFLPEKPPLMWDATFELTEIGKLVLKGKVPHCLINGFNTPDCKMPPLKAGAVAKGISRLKEIPDTDSESLSTIISEPDFATPCVIEGTQGGGWGATGKGSITSVPNIEVSGKEVHLSLIPGGLEQESCIEKVESILEEVPGVERVEARADNTKGWYRVVVKCKTEHSASSSAEAIVASAPLKNRTKIAYAARDESGTRIHTSPQEILRGFMSDKTEEEIAEITKILTDIDDGSRCVTKTVTLGAREEGPLVIWMVDSACRNKVLPLSSIKMQSRGGKGAGASGDDVKIILLTRVRTRAALLSAFGSASIIDVRPPDPCEGWLHPAETLPEGATMPATAIWPNTEPFAVLLTNLGGIKKVDATEITDGRKGTKMIIKTSSGDGLVACTTAREDSEVVLISALGQALKLDLKDVRSMGTGAKGIAGLGIKDGDRAVAAVTVTEGKDLFIFTSRGVGKRIEFSEITSQNRGGQGSKIIEMDEESRITVAVAAGPNDEIILGTREGKIIRFGSSDFSPQKRGAGGVEAIDLGPEDAVLSGVVIPPREIPVAETLTTQTETSTEREN